MRELIGVLISEDLTGEAWAAAIAAPGQVPHEQWLELIGLRESGHPADVIGPLRDLIEAGIERTSDKYRYPKAIKALGRLGTPTGARGTRRVSPLTWTNCGNGSTVRHRSSPSWTQRSRRRTEPARQPGHPR